jgi:hypothetical protein
MSKTDENGRVRADTYQFTITDLNDEKLTKLRLRVQLANGRRLKSSKRFSLPRWRVRIMGRLGKGSKYAVLYRGYGGVFSQSSARTIRPEHAERFDVYVTTDTQRWDVRIGYYRAVFGKKRSRKS